MAGNDVTAAVFGAGEENTLSGWKLDDKCCTFFLKKEDSHH